nr:type II toxin-antitoxin system ParD family antitoxin [Ciceribacter lividus]
MFPISEHHLAVRSLENALIEGEQSGEPRPFDFEAFKKRKRASL